MKVLVGGKWKDGFMDYYRSPEEYRIQVLAWKNLEKLEGLYFIPPKRFRLLWNYLCEIGPVEVLKKFLSRRRERYRNEKYVSCGIGRVIESADELKFPIGKFVVFFATNHPPCVQRVVLPEELMLKVNNYDISFLSERAILYKYISNNCKLTDFSWEYLRGWSSYSGRILDKRECIKIMKKVAKNIQETNWQDAKFLYVDEGSIVKESKILILTKQTKNNKKKRAVLFGYGNYAKTIILPDLRNYLTVDCIHEIDPTQIPIDVNYIKEWDTSPGLRKDKYYDVFLIAGFHHTHAPLAICALQHNIYAVVEKPIVVNADQLTELLAAMENSAGQLFSCFHKRYIPFNKLAIRDLGLVKGDPVSYHCIVYEVPLPNLHWYRWPNSKSRLVSNGCHWIDHFLYLNNFCKVESSDLFIAKDSTINCSLVLENGAFFTMVLTDNGSRRIGVQDYIELRANGKTVKMINSAEYFAEDRDRIIRRVKINKMQSYRLMYQQIGRKIINNERGDSLHSIEVSGGAIIELDNKLRKVLNNKKSILF